MLDNKELRVEQHPLIVEDLPHALKWSCQMLPSVSRIRSQRRFVWTKMTWSQSICNKVCVLDDFMAFNTKFLFRSESLPLIVTQISTIKQHVCLYTRKQGNDTDENDESLNNVCVLCVLLRVWHMKHELSSADASILCMYLLVAVRLLSVTYNTCVVESGGIGLVCTCSYKHTGYMLWHANPAQFAGFTVLLYGSWEIVRRKYTTFIKK